MATIGIDLGTDNSVVALARRGGIDVVLNEQSRRYTPTVVSFTDKDRQIGEAALAQAVMNYKNTIVHVKRLLGLKWKSPQAQHELRYINYVTREAADGGIEIEVTYQNEKVYFTPERIAAMVLQKMKTIAEKDYGAKFTDAVLSVPVHFSDAQRRAVIQAAQIAGLNVLRLMNETTAVALYYGIYKKEVAENESMNVVFVDVGLSSTTVSVVSFLKNQLKVLAHTFERNLGGRDFDMVLCDYLVQEIKTKYNMDINTNAKARVRLMTACERVKKVLSANSQAMLNIDCLMNDRDVNIMVQRSTFEDLMKPLLERFRAPIVTALEKSHIPLDKLHSVEIIGGGVRVPALKNALKDIFGREPNTTLNAAEDICRGCAIHAAMLSPAFKVREFAISDVTPFSVALGWKSLDPDAMDIDCGIAGINKKVVVIKPFESFPCSKQLNFQRNEPFELYSFYEQPEYIPEGTDFVLGRHVVSGLQPDKPADAVKVKVKVDIHGIFNFEGAQKVSEVEVPDPEPAPKPTEDAGNAQATSTNAQTTTAAPTSPVSPDQAAAAAAPVAAAAAAAAPTAPTSPQLRMKKIKQHVELPVESYCTFGLSQENVQKYFDEELQMQLNDRVVVETAEMKNQVETYVYEFRTRIGEYGDLSPFITEPERTKFVEFLNDTESWLYNEGEDATKGVYAKRLEQLKAHGDPIVRRLVEAENQARAAVEAAKAAEEAAKAAEAAKVAEAARVAADAAKAAAEAENQPKPAAAEPDNKS